MNKITEEQLFLDGPRSRWKEFVFMLKVFFEFFKGFRKFHFLGPCATVFGSARFDKDHPYYQMGIKMGNELARLGFTVMTGGGSGLMEAANRGAKEVNGKSVGCNITLPNEQKANLYLDECITINYFFVRKVLLTKYSFVFIVLPGGYGTLDEFFESLTLIKTFKIKNFPVVLMGKNYHKQLMIHIELMEKNKTISSEEEKMFLFTDSVEEAIEHIKIHSIQKFKLKEKGYKPFKIFWKKNKM